MDKACVDGLKDLYEEVTQIPSFTGVLKADSPKGQIILKRLVAKALLASLFPGPTQAPTRSLTGISWAGPRAYPQLYKILEDSLLPREARWIEMGLSSRPKAFWLPKEVTSRPT